MKRKGLIIIGLIISFSLGFLFKTIITGSKGEQQASKESNEIKEPKKVTGVAGIFFESANPDSLMAWYRTHLGFDINAYGTRFEWQEGPDSKRKGALQWSPFPDSVNFFAPSPKEFMINYRVENLTELVEQLRKGGVEIVDTLETYQYGKFIHIMDIEGNKIELYEPNYDYVPAE